MESLLLIFICLLAGLALQRMPQVAANAYQSLNQFVVFVSLPALALFYIPKIKIDFSLLYPLGIAWITFGLAFLFFSFLGEKFGWSKRLTGCLILTAGLGNTSFVGFPIIEALFGEEGLKTAVIVDQPGTFVVMATLGIWTATVFSNRKNETTSIARKVLLFPPFIAFLIAVLLSIFKLDFPEIMQFSFERLGNTVTPIALISVGMQLKFDRRNKHFRFLWLGLFFKLILIPLFFVVFYVLILGGTGRIVEVSIIESAMAPMITGSIVASQYGLKPKLSSMMVGIGIPVSFVTIAVWYWILQMVR